MPDAFEGKIDVDRLAELLNSARDIQPTNADIITQPAHIDKPIDVSFAPDPDISAAFAQPEPLPKKQGTISRFVKQAGVGFVETAGTFPKALEWAQTTLIGEDPVIKEFAPRSGILKEFNDNIDDWVAQRTPEDIDLSDQIARGIGGIPLFFIPAMGAAKAAEVAKVAANIGRWYGIGTMAVLDSASAGGQVYSDELKKTGDADIASAAATKTFLLNMPVSVVMDRLGIFGDVSRVGVGGIAERALKSGAAGTVGAGIMTPAIAKFKDEDLTAEEFKTSLIVGGTVASLMGTGVQLLGYYNGKPVDYTKEDPAFDALVDAAHEEKAQDANAILGKEEVAEDIVSQTSLDELENLNTGFAREEASQATGEPDFKLRSEEELISDLIETGESTKELDTIIAEKIVDLYALRDIQQIDKAIKRGIKKATSIANPITSDLSPAEKSAGAISSLLKRAEMQEAAGLAIEERVRKSPEGRSKLREQLGTDEVAPEAVERILSVYDVALKRQESAIKSKAEETLLIADTRKKAIEITNKPTEEFTKSLPESQPEMTAVMDEVVDRHNNSPLGNKLKELKSNPDSDPAVIKSTEEALAKSSAGQKLEVAKKQQTVVNDKDSPTVEVEKEIVAPVKKKKISKKKENIAKLRAERITITKERNTLAEQIHRSEIGLLDTTPEHLKMLDRMEILDDRLSQIAFSLNERASTSLKDITQVIPDFLRLIKDVAADPRQINEGLESVGKVVYKTGMNLKEFIKGMKDALGSAFEKFSAAMGDLYNVVKKILAEERGSIKFTKKTMITPDVTPEEATTIIKDADDFNRSLSETDIRHKAVPAIKLADGTVKEGKSYKDIGNYASESPVQDLGYVLDNGTFVPASDFAPGVKVTKKPIKVPKQPKTDVEEAISLMRSPAIERGSIRRPINTSESAITINDLKSIVKKMKKKAKAGNISVEDYMRDLGLSEKAIGEFMAIDALQTRGRNVIKKMTKTQSSMLQEHKDNGVDVDQVMKELGIEEPKEGKTLTYAEAGKINAFIQNDLGVKSGEVVELEVVLDSIMDGSRYVDKRSEATKTAGFIRDLLLSPKQVLSRTEIGTRLYKVFDRMQIMKEKDLEHLYGKTGFNLDESLHLLRPDNPSNEKIALVLDGQKKADGFLNTEEKTAVTQLRASFDYMAERFVKMKSKDEAEERLVRQLAETVTVEKGEKIKDLKKKLLKMQKDYDISKGGMEALDLLRMKKDDYLPHVFDRGDLIKTAAEKLQAILDKDPKSPQVEKLRDIITRLEGGTFIMHNEIPRDLFFAHMEKRQGVEGYKLDAGLAFQSYVNGWAKKVYVEPAVNAAKDLYIQLPHDQKSYAKWFIMEVAGRNKRHPGSAVVSQLEWIRTLGLSLGSALGNATGIVNTITEAGAHPHAWEGFKRATTKEGLQEFYSTGLARSIPQITAIEEVPHIIEKARTVAGVFFNTVERGLRNHAYHTGKAQGEAMGLSGDDLIWHSIDFVNKTQHRYGIVGMAQGMRGWMGVATQFSSYPIKQAELIHTWLRSPKGVQKVLAYMAMSAGINVTMEEFLATDVSNFLGIGITYGELMETGLALSKGDWLEAEKHWKLTTQGGHGILPSSIVPAGPFLGLLGEIHDTRSPRYLSRIGGELTPVMANKFVDFYYGIKDGDPNTDKYPVYSYEAKDMIGKITEGPKDLKYNLGLKSLILRTFGPRPSAETAKAAVEYSRFVTDDQIKKILKQYDKALLEGDSKSIENLFHLYPGIVYDRGTGGALRRRERLTKTRVERDAKRLKRQRQRASLDI